MNRYKEYFGISPTYDKVEFELGTFELRRDEQSHRKKLVFIDAQTCDETVLFSFARHIKPLSDFAVACSTFYPKGDRLIKLFFIEDKIPCETWGYISDPQHLYYVLHGALMCCSKGLSYEVISAQRLAALGFNGEIHYEDGYFWIFSNKIELVPRTYINYAGQVTQEPKRHKIAQEIMTNVDIFISDEIAYVFDGEKRERHSELVWEARSAKAEDVQALLDLHDSEDNLCTANAIKFATTVTLFQMERKTRFFERYMELWFTVYGRFWSGNEFKQSRAGLDTITEYLILKPDFEQIIKDYQSFERAVFEALINI